jgi:cytochrome c-type biogenesis protein CcmH
MRPADRLSGLLAALLCATAVACGAAPAAAAPAPGVAPQVSINDVEDEVMCPICGTLLELSDSPQARREKAFIAGQIAAGRSKAEIEDALVDEYGTAVLALPDGSGFELSAYLVPAIAFVLAAAALGLGAWRWRRRTPAERASDPQATPPAEGDSERLDADIARYDL